MTHEPFLSVKMAWPFLAAARRRDVDVEEVLVGAGLALSDVTDPKARIARSTAMALLDRVISATGDESLGLEAASWWCLVEDELLDHVGLTAPSLVEGTRAYTRYAKLLYPALDTGLVVDPEVVRSTYALLPPLRPHRAEIDFALGVMLVNFDRSGLPRPPVVEVRFTYPEPAETEPYRRVFGARLVFGHEENSVVFRRDAYERTEIRSNPKLHEAMKRHFDALLTQSRSAESLGARVQRTMLHLLPEGSLSEAGVAKALAMSTSSLRHRLHEEGTSYTRILEELRRDRALEQLSDPSLSIREIAEALGFSEVSAFSRAFKRWTGRSPVEHRRRVSR